MPTTKSARIHRFRDKVAVSIGRSPTLYLDAELAKELGEALVKYAKDVNERDFLASELRHILIGKEE